MTASRPGQPGWPAAIWCAIVLTAPTLAWLTAASGITIPATSSPPRDLTLLLAWSAAEEVVFRGGIQPRLAATRGIGRRLDGLPRVVRYGVSAANFVTSLLFCAAHLWSKPAAVTAAILPVSLLLGAAFERSGRLAVSVGLHAYFNVLLYAASRWHTG